MRGYENEKDARKAGVLPEPGNTMTDETQLPAWVRQARQIDRAKKMEQEIKAKR